MIPTSGTLLVVIIFLINTLGIVRYLFQWGDPASSPGYELVPTIFFVYWNLLTVFVIITLLVKTRKINLFFLCCYLYLIFEITIIGAISESFYVHGTARSLALNGFIFLLLSANAEFLSINKIVKCIEFLAALSIGFLLFQIVRVYIFEIYPSHSHPGYLVRYGSIYDDSLVLSIMAPMFAGLFLIKYQSFAAAIIICLVSLGVSFLTGSFTGILIMLLYLAWCKRDNPKLLFGLFFALVILAIWQFEYFLGIFLFKQDSISSHVEGWGELRSISLPTLLGIYPTDLYPEPGYVSFLLNFGAPMLLGFIGLLSYLIYICVSCLKNKSINSDFRLILGATEGLLISVTLANLNFPVVIFPPIYLMLAILSGVTFYHYSQRHHREIR